MNHELSKGYAARTEAAEHVERLEAVARGLLKAYAMGEARGGSMDWEDVDSVFEAAKQALPGEYEEALTYARAELGADDNEDEPPTYRIVRRYRQPPESEVIHEGYTLEEAQQHCEDPSTHGVDWMDTYEKE